MEQLNRRTFIKGAGTAAMAAGAVAVAANAANVLDAGPAGATVTDYDGFISDEGGEVFDIKNPIFSPAGSTNGIGAYGDTVMLTGGSITSGLTTFTAPAGTFVSSDAGANGKWITVQGAGASGGVLATSISGFTNSSTVTLGASASTTVHGGAFAFGHDDTKAIVNAINAAGSITNGTGRVFAPPGIYMIRGGTNPQGNVPLIFQNRGGLYGSGGKNTPGSTTPNTVFLCGDSTAGILTNGCAQYEGFLANGNNIATTPLQTGNTSAAGSHATFVDVWATSSTGVGWTILSSQNSGFYNCGSINNKTHGLYIDGAAGGLEFFDFYEVNNRTYGIYGDAVNTIAGGYIDETGDIHFFGGTCDESSVSGVCKIYLHDGMDWRFDDMVINGLGMTSPVVYLDQTLPVIQSAPGSPDVQFRGCTISATTSGNSPGNICLELGTSPNVNDVYRAASLINMNFPSGDCSVYLNGVNGYFYYNANNWIQDATTHGPIAASGVTNGIDTYLRGRTGSWIKATITGTGWTGNVYYRVNSDGRIQLKGSASGGSAGATIFTLGSGYYSSTTALVIPCALSTGIGYLSITTAGAVSVTTVVGTLGTVYFDDVAFPIA